ncbi:MAG TPA: EamA family transporter [Bryobacteraceae bacterium]|jgi:drug/metabolite transporter (DMT)-like permease|nr:EamA family transporter [Bryobacteraceae bacterium]
MTTPTSSILLVLGASFVGSFGAAFLKSGADRLHRQFITILTNWRLALGVFFFLASSLLYLKGIKDGELTILYPMVSLGNVWTLCWSRVFFHEPVTRNKLAGVGLILLGIVFLAFGGR